MLRRLLLWLGLNQCSRCGHWSRYWVYVNHDAHQVTLGKAQVICWDCREYVIVPGFQP